MKNLQSNPLKQAKNLASFRDPSGFIFYQDGMLFRQVNLDYKENYDYLLSSGLYQRLVDEKLLIAHTEVNQTPQDATNAYKILQPTTVPFISYPYEWCFSQLKDAALVTIKIQKLALEYGMILKDASAYNIQFLENRPLLIDTLSFEKYTPTPWVAYRQFCQHFLAPLALMSYTDINHNRLLQLYIDGLPLELAAKVLPKKSYFNLGLLLHLHMHARWQKEYADPLKKKPKGDQSFSKNRLRGLIDNLDSAVQGLHIPKTKTEWGDYYNDTNYTNVAFEQKKVLIENFVSTVSPKLIWDIGGNTGVFSEAAANVSESLIMCTDIDPLAIERLYRNLKNKNQSKIFPLINDLANPSPAIGWFNNERDSLLDRMQADLILALALIHHLSISNNLPFTKVAELFSRQAKYLVIEFVPKSDSQVQRLLQTRKDVFTHYTQTDFERTFQMHFEIIEQHAVVESDRLLYLMKSKQYDK